MHSGSAVSYFWQGLANCIEILKKARMPRFNWLKKLRINTRKIGIRRKVSNVANR